MDALDFLQSLRRITLDIFGKQFFDVDAFAGAGTERSIVTKTGTLVEGNHFSFHYFSPLQTGKKAVAAVLSDFFVMGGKPRYLLCTLALPTYKKKYTEVFRGVCLAAKNYGIELVGGDTTMTKKDVVIGVTLIGSKGDACTKHLSSFKKGDYLFVVGSLGVSHAGLRLLQSGKPVPHELQYCIDAHLEPEILTSEILWLRNCPLVTALTDNSDGLCEELTTIKRINGCSISIDNVAIFIDEGVQGIASMLGEDAREYALCGGEDFSLLVGVKGTKRHEFEEAFDLVFPKMSLHFLGVLH